MADEVRKMLDLTGTQFADGQVARSITPQDMRDFLATMKTQMSVYTQTGTQAISTIDTWTKVAATGTLVKANGFSEQGSGVYQYDAPPKDSVTGTPGTRSFLALGICDVEPISANTEFWFGFGVDGIVPVANTVTAQNLISLTLPTNVVFGGIIPDLGSGEQVFPLVLNHTDATNITFNLLTVVLIGIND